MAEMLVDSTKLNACLDAEANAIRAKTGGASDIPFDFANNKGFADAIAAIPSGGGGSGYAKKTGSFVLATDYTYSDSVANGYRGSLMVDTGLTNIDFVALWVEEWIEQTMGNATGAGFYIAMNNAVGLQKDNAGCPSYYIPAVGVLKNNATSYFFGDTYGGIVTHSVCPNDVPEGSFGFKCRSGAYGVKAGYTVRWEAVGEE